jgi:hypothetical protein
LSLLPIQPYIHDAHSHIISIDFHIAMILNLMKHPFNTYTVNFFPVFEPNEYFWKHHWEPNQDKEKKYHTYARVIREIMINNSKLKDGIKWSNLDRIEY